MGFSNLMPIQEQTYGLIRAGDDFVALAAWLRQLLIRYLYGANRYVLL